MPKIDEQHPFPFSKHGDTKIKYYERILKGGAISQYVTVNPIRFMDNRARELISQGATVDDLYSSELSLLGRPPNDDAVWLYVVRSFEVHRQHHVDQETFTDNAMNYKKKCFDDFEDVIKYCRNLLGSDELTLVDDWQTNYPQW